MKKLIKSSALIAATLFAVSSFAQLNDEKNVTITMDLQPVLQLKMEGPDNIEFTFDEINEYYAGITKYGATILKVSSSVSWDLWAAGLSNGTVATQCWDNPLLYGANGPAPANTNSVNTIPVTALELRQFPANPQGLAATCANNVVPLVGTFGTDYSLAFQPYNSITHTSIQSNNCIYAPLATAPYAQPAASVEKYIAGGKDNTSTTAGCAVVGGSYLLQPFLTVSSSSYYYVIDYRIMPGLPVIFPVANATNLIGVGSTTQVAAGVAADAASTKILYSTGAAPTAGIFVAPGVYTMYVKYILQEDN